MRTLVMKFGGSTVGTTIGLSQLVSIVLYEHERWDRLLLVVSALDGVTDQLIEAAQNARLGQQRTYRRVVANVRKRHMALTEALTLGSGELITLQNGLDSLLYDMLDQCESLAQTPASTQTDALDAIIGTGERLAARIVAALLRQTGLRCVAVDTTDLIITDSTHGNAIPNMTLTCERVESLLQPMVERGILPVLTGFIGATVGGEPTTLGRGGSDYSASILAVCAGAAEVWMWTDVDGIMSADPLDVPDSRSIPHLTYAEAEELASFGARILHARMIKPLHERDIPLHVRSVFMPRQPGTVITNRLNREHSQLQAVTSITGVGVRMEGAGSLAEITRITDELLFSLTGSRTEIAIVSQSTQQTFVCFVVPNVAGPDAAHILQIALQDRIAEMAPQQNWKTELVTVVTAVISQIGLSHHWSARVLDAISGIDVLGTAYSPARSAISLVVHPRDAEQTLRKIHALIVPSNRSPIKTGSDTE